MIPLALRETPCSSIPELCRLHFSPLENLHVSEKIESSLYLSLPPLGSSGLRNARNLYASFNNADPSWSRGGRRGWKKFNDCAPLGRRDLLKDEGSICILKNRRGVIGLSTEAARDWIKRERERERCLALSSSYSQGERPICFHPNS